MAAFATGDLGLDLRGGDGVELHRLGLWLDPASPRPRAFASHAGLAAALRCGWLLASAGTAGILAALDRARGPGRRVRPPRLVAADYGRPHAVGVARATLHPSGFAHGAACLSIERRGRRLLYAGAVDPQPGELAEPLDLPRCDTLVLRWSLGDAPRPVLPPRAAAARRLVEFARDALAAGLHPVVLAPLVGEAAHAALVLGRAGVPLAAHRLVRAVCREVAAAGRGLPSLEQVVRVTGPGWGPARRAILWPDHLAGSPALRRLTPRRVAVIGPRALGAAPAGVDRAIPLLCRADYAALLDLARASRAEVVLVAGGGATLAEDLAATGLDARALHAPRQLSLPVTSGLGPRGGPS